MIRILIADDHEVVRNGLRFIIEGQDGWEVVAEAANGKEAIEKAQATEPDVAVLDYSMSLVDGVEATRRIRRECPRTQILLFTLHESQALVREILTAGARGILLKSDTKSHLISAIEALSDQKPYFSGQVSETLLGAFLLESAGNGGSALAPRERLVVQLIAQGHTNKEMGALLKLSIKTIESHRAAAMRKLNLTSTAAIVRYAIRNKLVED